MTIATFFILGLIIGSFLNVLVFRLHLAESFIWGRSKCPKCGATIRWYDNIPLLSFILLGFRCRDCREKISWQYPLVEFITGLGFALIAKFFWVFNDPATWALAIYYWGLWSLFVTLLVYDLLYMEIPGLVLWPTLGWAVIFNLIFDWSKTGLFDIFQSAVFSGTLGAFVSFIFFFLLVSISKEKWMGMGDAYLAIILGCVLGWPKILLGMMLAFAIGAIVGIILIIFKKKNLQSHLPFVPFFIVGSVIALFFYQPITQWYFNLFF